jgi:hypothetical protein
VECIELAAPDGEKIIASVEVAAVPSPDVGCAIARTVVDRALNRLSYFNKVVIGAARIISKDFQADAPGMVAFTAAIEGTARALPRSVALDVKELSAALEPASHHGEAHFEAFRSARSSLGPVEEFVDLYGILMRLFGDNFAAVDAFIRTVERSVAQTPSKRPGAKPGEMETIYTRLRHELAHTRNVPTGQTKTEIAAKVGDLREVVWQAIKQSP